MNLRPPFLALVTGGVPGDIDGPLNILGARAIFVPDDTLSAALRRGRDSVLEAEVVVIDAIVRSRDGSHLIRAINIASELRGLPSSATMPTGVPWNAVPIVIMAVDHAVSELVRYNLALRSITTCASIDGWESCYARMATAAINFSISVAEDMASILPIKYENGRYYRESVTMAEVRRLKAKEISTPLYDPSADLYFSLLEIGQRMYRAVAADHHAIEHDAQTFHDLVEGNLAEVHYQRFIEERPHVVDAARHEMIPQLKLYRADGQCIPLDIAIVPIPEYATSAPCFIEIKTPRMRLLSGRNPHRATLSQPATKALRQVRDYKETALLPGNGALPGRFYNLNAEEASMMVVGGLAARDDRKVLDRERNHQRDVKLLGYDELAENFVHKRTVSAEHVLPTALPDPEPMGTSYHSRKRSSKRQDREDLQSDH